MRNRFILGLFTTVVLVCATPVAAEEYSSQGRSSLTTDIEDIQDMIQRSQERQGSLQKTQEEKEPIATIPEQITEAEPVITPISEPISPPNSVSIVTEKVQLAPGLVTQSTVSATNPESSQSTQGSTSATIPIPSTVPSYITEPQSQITPQSKVVPQISQQVAVRHANRHRHQSAKDEPPSINSTVISQEDPTREQQLSHKGFMLFAADLAWKRVDNKHDYALGARLERGVISPLAAIRVYAPDKLSEALSILSGQKEYT